MDIINKTKFLSEKTKNIYKKKINEISNILKENNIMKIIENPELFNNKICEYCDNKKLGDHTKVSFYSPILSIFNHNSELKESKSDLFIKWNQLYKNINENIEKKYKKNEPTEKQKQAYINYEDIIKTRDKLKTGTQEKLLLCMYTMIPPMRSDYWKTEIIKSNKYAPSTDNYICLNPPQLILQKYKTSKTYGKLIIDLPQELIDEIKINIKKIPRKYLFVSPIDNKQFNNNCSFNKWANNKLKKIFNNDYISLTFLRHIYISRKDLNLINKSGLEREIIAKKMAHSLNQQQKYVWLNCST